MRSFYIGSGETAALLAGKQTQSHKKLLQRFVSDEIPYYNALNSPIDALRTGAILEGKYFEIMPDNFYSQYRCVCEEMDVLRASIDFAELDNGNIINFEELKTCNFDDFLNVQNGDIEYIKKNYRNNYNQVQHQLLCTGLDSATIVFLVVYSYDDEENYNREIQENEYVKFKVERDENVISNILERAKPFQMIKDYYEK